MRSDNHKIHLQDVSDLHIFKKILRLWQGLQIFFGTLNGGRGGPGAGEKICWLAPSPRLGWTPPPGGRVRSALRKALIVDSTEEEDSGKGQPNGQSHGGLHKTHVTL